MPGTGNNLSDIEKRESGTRYFFEHDDICNIENDIRILEKYKIDFSYSSCGRKSCRQKHRRAWGFHPDKYCGNIFTY